MITTFAQDMRRNGQLSPAIKEFAREVRAQMVEDLTCTPPDVILVDNLRMTEARGLKAIKFFSEDEGFRALFSHYKKTRIWGNFTSYVKDPRWDPVRPPSCRRIY
jgi:cupin superfamily acireductone dioxygenase involved in methionine salvage